ncbi:MAG: SDR family oxidoreductase [Acidobacteria bacterium]|nr:SDR family oxidoreductase [Acidobacteriota bacterium]
MKLQLHGKTALVCAGSKGIGAAAARQLASLGCRVMVIARSQTNLDEVCASLDGSGHITLQADMNDHKNVIEKISDRLDETGPIEIVINNMAGPKGGPLLGADAEEIAHGMHGHVLLAHKLAQLLVPGMQARSYGRIVNIISTSVKVPIVGLGVSNTVRGAMANWAKTMSIELAPHGITVNNVLPGFTETERLESIITARAAKSGQSEEGVRRDLMNSVPAGRFGTADEVGSAIAFLASPAAGYINGINLPVDGGRTGCL